MSDDLQRRINYFYSVKQPLFLLLILSRTICGAQELCIDKIYEEIVGSESNSLYAKQQVMSAAPTSNYDIKYHRIHFNLSPDELYINGRVTSCFELLENSADVYFDMTDSLMVDSIFYHDEQVDFEHTQNAIRIFFPVELIAGTFDSVTIFYKGIPSDSLSRSMSVTEQESGNNLWTLSEPYGASDWWPCKQSVTDKIDSMDIFITVPDGNGAGAPGMLISEISNDGLTTFHWKTKYPMATYLFGISISNFDVYSFYAPHFEDSVLFYNLIFPQDFDAGVEGINALIPAWNLFLDLFGDYPFKEEKYGHMQFGWGGGMEHQTISSVIHFNFDLLVHELAHQWFGDKVTCGTWKDIWLNEGFATYSTGLAYYYIDDIHIYWKQWLTGTRDFVTSEPGGSVACTDTTDHARIFNSRLTYYKGAWLLHMLHWTLGEDVYFEAIREYLSDPEHAYGFAVTNDLIEHLEAVSDTSLTGFFDDWYSGEGYPSYQVMWTQDVSGVVTISLGQKPSHSSVGFFEMNVPLRLKGGHDSLDVIIHHLSNEQLNIYNPGFDVKDIILDPDMWLLHANDVIIRTEPPGGASQLIIFPNPTDGLVTIQHLTYIDADYVVKVFDVHGRFLFQTAFNANTNNARVSIDLSSLGSGIYFLSVSSDQNSLVQKVVVR